MKDDVRDDDPLFPTDEYEQYIDDISNGLAMCEGVDCRSPMDGPWCILVDDDVPLRLLCFRCFCEETLRVDPDEVGH